MQIRGGRVVTAGGERAAYVLVDGEKIVGVGPRVRGNGQVLDAGGFLRGQIVYQDGVVVGKSDFGRFQPCQRFDPAVAWP